MRRFLYSSLVVITLAGRAWAGTPAAPLTAPGSPLLAHKRVLVLGDSITQDGRYVSFLEYYLHRAGQPCDLISIGLSSETVSGLSERSEATRRPCVLDRLDRALAAVKPQVVLACYGMNDGIYHPPSPEILGAFQTGLHRLIEKIRATGAQLILLTPPVFDPQPIGTRTVPAGAADYGYAHPFAGYDTMLAEFTAAELALKEPGVTVIDLHTPLAQALAAGRAANPAFGFTQDGVHPGEAGHLLMAQIIARGLGLAFPAGPLEPELARLGADPVFTLVRERRELRSEAWLPYVGYTRGPAYQSDSVGAAERVAARLLKELDALP